jgi:hypothetical protein
MTIKQAKALKIGDVVWNSRFRNKDGSAGKWRVCCEDKPFRGESEEERTYPFRVRVMVKRRFGEYDWISELELDEYSISKPSNPQKAMNPNDAYKYLSGEN